MLMLFLRGQERGRVSMEREVYLQSLGSQPAKHIETALVLDISADEDSAASSGDEAGAGPGGAHNSGSRNSSPKAVRSSFRSWKRALSQLIIDRTSLVEVRWVRMGEAARYLQEPEANLIEDVQMRF